MGVATREQAVVDSLPHGLFINGDWVTTDDSFEVVNPATGEAFASVPDASVEQATAALDAACEAGPAWASTPPRQRADLLHSVFELINERAEIFAALMTMEMGKPYGESLGEVSYGNEYLRWFSEEACRIHGYCSVAPSGGKTILTKRVPVGPVVAITPWNFPLAMATRKIAPALAAGCPVVIKPSRLTPLTTLLLCQTLADAGLPAGLVNCITTSRSGEVMTPLIEDSRTRKLTFTGSTAVGVSLLRQGATRVLRTSMELGGNAPFVVLGGADVDAAVEGAMAAKMRNHGEACTAANRFLVHRSLADEFASKLASAMGALTIGYGLDDSTQLGPMVDGSQRDAVLELIADAQDRGATTLIGGHALDRPGFFMEPTVMTDIQSGSRVEHEEIFGPFAPIFTFENEDEAAARANDTDFGLAAYVFAGNRDHACRFADRIETGMVAINSGLLSDAAAPFGGVKMSGLGREGGPTGIDEYLETKYYSVA